VSQLGQVSWLVSAMISFWAGVDIRRPDDRVVSGSRDGGQAVY